jgi:hypothetical protein
MNQTDETLYVGTRDEESQGKITELLKNKNIEEISFIAELDFKALTTIDIKSGLEIEKFFI